LCVDRDDCPLGHCSRTLLDPVAQLAVKHSEQRQNEVGLPESCSLVVDTNEDVGDVLFRDLLCVVGLADVDRRNR
jgi:hypothetical protein